MATTVHETIGYDRSREDDAPSGGTAYVVDRGGGPARRWKDRIHTLLALVHRIIGAPDYDTYLAHARRCHPERTPLTRDEFVRQRLEDRYSRPGARCC